MRALLSSIKTWFMREKTAYAFIKLHDRANWNKGKEAPPNPQESAKAYPMLLAPRNPDSPPCAPRCLKCDAVIFRAGRAVSPCRAHARLERQERKAVSWPIVFSPTRPAPDRFARDFLRRSGIDAATGYEPRPYPGHVSSARRLQPNTPRRRPGEYPARNHPAASRSRASGPGRREFHKLTWKCRQGPQWRWTGTITDTRQGPSTPRVFSFLGPKPPLPTGRPPTSSSESLEQSRHLRRIACDTRARTFRHNRRSTQRARIGVSDRRQPLTTGALAASYLELCSDPLQDIRRWAIESERSYKGAASRVHAHGMRSAASGGRVPQRSPPLRKRLRSPNASLANPAQSPLTTRQLTADYLNLCRSPLPDIQRWIAESKPAYTAGNADNLETWRTSHAQTTSPGLARAANRFCDNPLHAMRGGLDPHRAGSQCRRLSSRPGAGLYQYDQLRSLRAQTETSAAEARSLPPTASTPGTVAPSPSLAGELAAAKGYYASRIAAARLTLSQAELALAIRAINDEQTLASRTIIQRWEGYFQNQKQGTVHEPERPNSNRPPPHVIGSSARTDAKPF